MSHNRHRVQFYQDAAALAASISDYLRPALTEGEGALLVLAREQLTIVREHLRREGYAESLDSGRFRILLADEVVDELLAGDFLSSQQFNELIGRHVTELQQSPNGCVWIVGDGVSELMRRGKPQLALELERLWNQMIERFRLSVLCTYSSELFFHNDEQMSSFLNICAEHSSVGLPPDLWDRERKTH